jgi:uncharacterized protein YxjI
MAAPLIDPNIEFVGVSKLRELTGETLRKMKKTLVIQDGDKPIAVIVKYSTYMRMQRELTNLRRYLDAAIPDRDT